MLRRGPQMSTSCRNVGGFDRRRQLRAGRPIRKRNRRETDDPIGFGSIYCSPAPHNCAPSRYLLFTITRKMTRNQIEFVIPECAPNVKTDNVEPLKSGNKSKVNKNGCKMKIHRQNPNRHKQICLIMWLGE